jgi:hypothetical protein
MADPLTLMPSAGHSNHDHASFTLFEILYIASHRLLSALAAALVFSATAACWLLQASLVLDQAVAHRPSHSDFADMAHTP